MSIASDVREFFQKPEHLGFERPLIALANDLGCDDEKSLGIALWAMAHSGELLREKNDENKWVYRYNPKFKPSGRASITRKKKVVAKNAVVTPGVKTEITPSRWAVTEDGAFVDMNSPGSGEISAPRARSLVAFVRKLDGATA